MKPRKVVVPVGPSIAYVQLTKGKYALIDSCDAEMVGGHNWYAFHHKKQDTFYAMTRTWLGDQRKTLGLHRFILGLAFGDGLLGDHRNRNTLDYRRTNLRPATPCQNSINKRIDPRSKTGFPGLFPLPGTNSWRVTIRRENVKVCQRQFPSYDAAFAYWMTEYPKHSGEFALSGLNAEASRG